jgi:hypothetical protein
LARRSEAEAEEGEGREGEEGMELEPSSQSLIEEVGREEKEEEVEEGRDSLLRSSERRKVSS